MKSRIFVFFILFVSLFFFLFRFSASPTLAHTLLENAEPASGKTYYQSPRQIVLTFNEALASGSTLILYPRNFQAIEGISVTLSPTNPKQLVATLPPLAAAVYTVQWTTISQDGHKVTGSYHFQVIDTRSFIIYWVVAVGIAVLLFVGGWWLAYNKKMRKH